MCDIVLLTKVQILFKLKKKKTYCKPFGEKSKLLPIKPDTDASPFV